MRRGWGNLRRHLKFHAGEKSHKCNQYDYASVQMGLLRRHLRTHTGEKPYKCNQCEFSSIAAGNLTRHLKTHTREKTYKCNQCDYASVQADHLRHHFKTHSGKKKHTNVTNVNLLLWQQVIWNNKIHTGKNVKMQQSQQCFFWGGQFKRAFPNSLRRNIIQMQPMWLCIRLSKCDRVHFALVWVFDGLTYDKICLWPPQFSKSDGVDFWLDSMTVWPTTKLVSALPDFQKLMEFTCLLGSMMVNSKQF